MNKLNLLILEDMMTDAELIILTLRRSGMDFDYTITNDCESFTNAIEQQKFDAILADNSLPQFSGVEALRIINARQIITPFILVTGSISEEYAVSIMKEGACDYILKDRLQRLPNAVLSAIHKYHIEKERKKFLDEVIANEALLKEAEQLANFGSWERDLVNNTERWSDEQFRILGYKPGEIEPSFDNFLKMVHHDERELVRQTIDYTIKHLGRQKYSCKIVSKDGALKHIYAEIAVARDADNKVVRINGFIRDVSETVHATKSLQKSEANLRAIFDNTETAYVLLDADLKVVSFNQLAHKISVELLEKPLADGNKAIEYFAEEERPVVRKYLQSVLRGSIVSYEMNFPHPEAYGKWFNINYYPVWNNDKQVLGVIMAINEITAKKVSELQEKKITAELMQRNQDLEQFAYIISHNLRSPVANIIGITDALVEGNLDEDDKQIFMDGLTVSVKKLDSTIIDLNDILQVKNVVVGNKEKVHFSEIVDDIKFSIGGLLDEKGVMINSDFSEVDEVSTFKSYMLSIFYNLISNSIKYRKLGMAPIIDIKSRKLADKIELLFRDNSIGMDLESKSEQVFGLYKRFHPQHAEGKGMGLFMVKTQVETLGGKISVKSKVNEGTEFKIEFDVKAFAN
jgi:PAS domain S-box-containing protein